MFSVTLNYISEKVLPELTDAWVAENYGESDGVHTVEELKALYQKMLYNTNLQNAIMDDLLANSTFKGAAQGGHRLSGEPVPELLLHHGQLLRLRSGQLCADRRWL